VDFSKWAKLQLAELAIGANMTTKLNCLMLFLCVAVSGAFSQEAMKVEPKHYKLAFENENVQVVDVHYGPHEKSGMHDHPGGVVVYITGGHLKFTDQDGNVKEVYAKPGESRMFPPFKHKVENLGDKPFDAVYVGLKNKAKE
jgi:quercetin dioxygenase-like cupin family protein